MKRNESLPLQPLGWEALQSGGHLVPTRLVSHVQLCHGLDSPAGLKRGWSPCFSLQAISELARDFVPSFYTENFSPIFFQKGLKQGQG